VKNALAYQVQLNSLADVQPGSLTGFSAVDVAQRAQAELEQTVPLQLKKKSPTKNDPT
jgi:hypothetical protein